MQQLQFNVPDDLELMTDHRLEVSVVSRDPDQTVREMEPPTHRDVSAGVYYLWLDNNML